MTLAGLRRPEARTADRANSNPGQFLPEWPSRRDCKDRLPSDNIEELGPKHRMQCDRI